MSSAAELIDLHGSTWASVFTSHSHIRLHVTDKRELGFWKGILISHHRRERYPRTDKANGREEHQLLQGHAARCAADWLAPDPIF